MQRSNFHTHTIFSDGTDTPIEMIESAVEYGFTSLGFSDHSYESADDSYVMTREQEKQYLAYINSLKNEYRDKINIYCGVELDGDSDSPELDFDYILSSVHQLIVNGVVYSIDTGVEKHMHMINEGFHGSATDMSKAYFNRLTEHVIKNKTDIVGHFDLITKYSLVPENEDAYINAALEAVREIMKHCRLFELNTGAIARGLRNVPYPAGFILDEIKRLGGSIIITSDCHMREKLMCQFEESRDLLMSHGFSENINGCINSRVKNIEIWG